MREPSCPLYPQCLDYVFYDILKYRDLVLNPIKKKKDDKPKWLLLWLLWFSCSMIPYHLKHTDESITIIIINFFFAILECTWPGHSTQSLHDEPAEDHHYTVHSQPLSVAWFY